VAPHLRLYSVDAGDMITLRAFTRNGYLKSLNLPVFGVFRFEGLEGSELAGTNNLIDLISLRELYGEMSEDDVSELENLRAEMQVEPLLAEDAVAALFGGGDADVEAKPSKPWEELDALENGILARETESQFDPSVLRRGLALNAAILLHDPQRLSETLREIRRVGDEAGLNLVAVDWQTASGMMGQFVTVIRLVLYIAITIVFIVAVAVMTTSMIIATMQRVVEFGTMRAIGSSKRLVFSLIVYETSILGSLAGLVGAALGAGIILVLGATGVPAGQNNVLTFLFSGERLHPSVSAGNIVLGFGLILVVSLASALYPARLATRVAPIVAMNGAE
ncbi:MAG: FtsX-like permease family protein, partial [Myxococcota bacterium]